MLGLSFIETGVTSSRRESGGSLVNWYSGTGVMPNVASEYKCCGLSMRTDGAAEVTRKMWFVVGITCCWVGGMKWDVRCGSWSCE